MTDIAAYPALLATVLSVTGLSYLAWRGRAVNVALTLSEIGAMTPRRLTYFRTILVLCGTLFAISMYGFVISRVRHSGWQTVTWTLTYIPELLLAAFPARGKTVLWHIGFTVLMGIGMLGSAVLFAIDLPGMYGTACAVLAVSMVASAVVGLVHIERFLIYELGFIFLAHATIVAAVLALI